VGDPGLGVDPELATAIDPLGCGREHLADPIGHQGEERLTGDGRHSLPPPASQVRHNDVLAEMQLRLVEDPPPAGPVDTPVEGISENHADLRSHRRVRLPRPGAQEQLPIEDLGHLVLGGVQHVLVRRALHRIGSAGLGSVESMPSLEPPATLTSLVIPHLRMGRIVARRKDSEGPEQHRSDRREGCDWPDWTRAGPRGRKPDKPRDWTLRLMTRNFQQTKILRAEGPREPLARRWLIVEHGTVGQRRCHTETRPSSSSK
jgi:hypothetical protein